MSHGRHRAGRTNKQAKRYGDDPWTVPPSRPFTRAPIKPGQRHKDSKNDYERRPKYPVQGDEE